MCTTQENSLQRLINQTVGLIQCFHFLLDSYVTGYYADSGWRFLPQSWVSEPCLTLPELYYLLSGFTGRKEAIQSQLGVLLLKRPLPLSLLAYRVACLSVQLNVDALSSCSEWTRWQNGNVLFSNSADLHLLLSGNLALGLSYDGTDANSPRSDLPPHFRRHVTPKKQHEIQKLSSLICQVAGAVANSRPPEAEERECDLPLSATVVDIGSGQGHLSRYLSLKYGLNVVSLEADSTHLEKASKFDRETQNYLKKKDTTVESFRTPSCDEPMKIVGPITCAMRISSGLIGADMNHMLQRLLEVDDSRCEPTPDIVLTGLHACGNLSTTILRLFTELESAKAVISVGCCYMKSVLDPNNNECANRRCPFPSQVLWSPQSEQLKSHGVQLSYSQLEAACHCIPAYLERLEQAIKTGDTSHLRVQGYRAVVELLLEKRRCLRTNHSDPVPAVRAIRCAVKNANSMDFDTYSSILLNRMKAVQQSDGATHQGLFDPFRSEELKAALPKISLDEAWYPIVRYHVLRLMLTPAVETLVLLDRLLWLREKGYVCCLVRLFDYVVSPRNIAVVATQSSLVYSIQK